MQDASFQLPESPAQCGSSRGDGFLAASACRLATWLAAGLIASLHDCTLSQRVSCWKAPYQTLVFQARAGHEPRRDCAWCGRMWLQIMLARAPHVAYTTFLCVFSAVAWVSIAALRSKMGNLALVVNLGFAFTSECGHLLNRCQATDCCLRFADGTESR